MKLCMVLSCAWLQVLKPFGYPYLAPLAYSRPKTAYLGRCPYVRKMSLCPTNKCPYVRQSVLMSDNNILLFGHTGGEQLKARRAAKVASIVLSNKKSFRQSNSLVISLIKTLLSRNFCQKCVRLNKSQQFPHHSVWKLREISLTNFWQKFRESDWRFY